MNNEQISILNKLYLAKEGTLEGRPIDRFEIEMIESDLAARFARGTSVHVPYKFRFENGVIHLSEIIWRKAV